MFVRLDSPHTLQSQYTIMQNQNKIKHGRKKLTEEKGFRIFKLGGGGGGWGTAPKVTSVHGIGSFKMMHEYV